MSGEQRVVQSRMQDWTLDFARRAERGIYSADERRWLNRIDDELPLIRHTLTAFAQDGDAARGVTLAAGIAGFWTIRGPLVEALQWFRTFLAIDRAGGKLPDQLRAVAIVWANRLGLESGDLPDIGETREARTTVVTHPCSAALWLRSTDHLVYELINGLGAVSANTPVDAALPTDPLDECLTLVAEGVNRARSAQRFLLAQPLPVPARAIGVDVRPRRTAVRGGGGCCLAGQQAPQDRREIPGSGRRLPDDEGRLARRPNLDVGGAGQPPGNRRPRRRDRRDDRNGRDPGRARRHGAGRRVSPSSDHRRQANRLRQR